MNNQNKSNSMETKENGLMASLSNAIVIPYIEGMSEEDLNRMIEEALKEQAEEAKLESELAYEVMMEIAKEKYFQSQMEESFIHDHSELEFLLKHVAAQKEIKTPDSDDLRDSQ